jgi:Mg2+-importing ATPase
MKKGEIPFDFERRRLSIVVTGRTLLVTKGAPEEILAVSTLQEIGETRRKLGEHERDECAEIFRNLSGRGFRVLAVACREVEDDDPSRQRPSAI